MSLEIFIRILKTQADYAIMLFFNRQKQQMKYKIFSTSQAEILIVDLLEHGKALLSVPE